MALKQTGAVIGRKKSLHYFVPKYAITFTKHGILFNFLLIIHKNGLKNNTISKI
jgi:hypothetical protein